MSSIHWLRPDSPPDDFPPVSQALRDPNGLIAAGGDLSWQRLVCAYRRGIFPWYEEGQPILWWTPDPRAVFLPGQLRVSRSLRKTLRRGKFSCTYNTRFADVVNQCAAPRGGQSGTWITRDMLDAYVQLHERGLAHSVECWFDGALVGGLYGISVGRVFCGESMFSLVPNASKVALCSLSDWLGQWGYALIDCQMPTAHLASLGAAEMPRNQYLALLSSYCDEPVADESWR